MAIPLTGPGGLFTILGRLAKVLRGAHVYAGIGGNLPTYMADAITALGTNNDLIAPLPTALQEAQASASNVGASLQQAARETLLKFVDADAPQPSRTSIPQALAELIRQMKVAGASVPACVVTVASSAASGNNGNGAVILTALRGDGLQQDLAFAEVGELVCTGDAQSQSAGLGKEPWFYRGDYATPSTFAPEWPGYSGATAGLTTIDSQTPGGGIDSQGGANILRGGSFDAFAVTDVPDNWTPAGGTAGVQFGRETSIVHRGASAFKFIGDGSSTPSLVQSLTLRPLTTYVANLWSRVSASASGQFTIDLFDGSSTINDDQGAANTFSVSAAGPTTYTSMPVVFRTPRVLPATIKLRLRMSVALQSGRSFYVDSVAMAPPTYPYMGGPGIAVFAGASPWVAGDRHAVTITNDRAGATFGSTWQTVMDRFFGTRQLNLLVPASGSPTIADSLLTS